MGCYVFARVPNFRPDPNCFYFPVLTRFRTYGVTLEPELEAYAERLESHSAVRAWRKLAASAPATPVYDEMIRGLGGDVNVGLIE